MQFPGKSEIESFLKEFKLKLETFDIFFLRREKNLQALLDLEITPRQRIEYLKKLKVEDYYRGPTDDGFDPDSLPFWEFGMIIKKKEVFIKISLWKNKNVLCISFHLAKKKMSYPYK